jgi:hypothetical protein
MSFYGSQLLDSGVYGSSYLSHKHLKRAMKYGSYMGGASSFVNAPQHYGNYLGGASVVNAPVEYQSYRDVQAQDSFVQAPVEHVSAPAVYSSQHFGGQYAPVEHTMMAAPMVHAPVYASRYHSKGGYRSNHFGKYISSNVYSGASFVNAPQHYGNYLGGASVVNAPVEYQSYRDVQAQDSFVQAPVEHVSAPAVYSSQHFGGQYAPVEHSYGTHSGLVGSSYLSRKHLKRAMKYGSYHNSGLMF